MTAMVLPAPLVKVNRHPIRWFHNKVILLLDAVVLAHIGMLIMVGLYFLLTQENATAKHWWDTTVSNSDLRHSIRDVGEGILGGFLAQGIVWNHFKKKHQKAGKIFDTLHDKLHVPRIPAALLATVLFGAAGFVAFYYLLHAFHVHAGAVGVNGSLLHRTQTIWSSSWDKKIMGYGAAFFARRPMRIIFDHVQLWFAERRVVLGKKPHFYHPPTFQARYNYLVDHAYASTETIHGNLQTGLMFGGLLVGLGLAGFGYYVLTFVA